MTLFSLARSGARDSFSISISPNFRRVHDVRCRHDHDGHDDLCLKCCKCKCFLDSSTARIRELRVYCEIHGKEFDARPLMTTLTRNRSGSLQKALFSIPSQLCVVCEKSVYENERSPYRAKDVHKSCMKCSSCGSKLEAGSARFIGGKLFCEMHGKQTEQRTSLLLQSPRAMALLEGERKEDGEEKDTESKDSESTESDGPPAFQHPRLSVKAMSIRMSMTRAQAADFKSLSCAQCDKPVFTTEKISVSGQNYHKNCFRCVVCRTKLSAFNAVTSDKRPFCRPHHKQMLTAGSGRVMPVNVSGLVSP
eukprot:622364_1